MPALLIDDDELDLDPHDLAYYDDVPEFRKERRESHSYGKELKTAALRPYKVWRDNFLQDRCIEKSALVPELLVACTPHILLNVLLLGYIVAGAYFLHWIDESVNKQKMPEAVLFAYTTITTIGYGNVCPTSQIGKIGCMLYCVGGIPLIYLVLSNNGQFLAEAVWILRNSFTSKKISAATKELPLWMTGVLLILHSLIGGLIFSYWIDQMKFIPAVYFSFISIATIGYGDLVPTPENWFQSSVIIVYMSTGIVILSTLVGSLSNYLQWIYNIGRPISGSKDIEVWFGGDMLTVEALVKMVADQFGVPPIRLGAVLTDLDEILRVACETEVQQQTENLRKLSKRESTVFQLNPEIRKMLLKYAHEESPTTSLTFGRFNTNKLFRTSSDSILPGHFSARETSMALQALGVIHHTLKTQRRPPGNRSPMASRQTSDATQSTIISPVRTERNTTS